MTDRATGVPDAMPIDKTDSGPLDIIAFALMAGAIGVMFGVLSLHLGLLTQGKWGGDEYRTIGHYADEGAPYLWHRFWTWSPRPFSEALIWLYAAAVTTLRKPLIVPALLVFWLACLVACLPALVRCPRGRFPFRLLGVTSLLAALVLGEHVASVLYWPFGAAAYAPVLAVTLFLLSTLANDRNDPPTNTAIQSAALVLAAWSSEAGAMFVLVYSAMMVTYLARRGRAHISTYMLVGRWAPPVLASLLVIAMIVRNDRATDPMFPGGDPTLYHHSVASLKAALLRIGPEFLALDGETFDWTNLVRGAVMRILFFAGICACWLPETPSERRSRPRLLILAAALVLTAVGMLAASYRQFGVVCCGQHTYLRQSFDLIGLAALAIATASLITLNRRHLRIAAPVALTAATLLLFQPRMAGLIDAYGHYREAARARALTWASGQAAGSNMTLYQPVPNRLFPAMIPPGRQVAADNWWSAGILTFFRKDSVLVVIAKDHDQP